MAVRREQIVKTAEKYVARGKIEAAIKEYRKVIDDQPNDSNTLNRVGDLYARIEKIPEAIELFTKIATNYTEDGFFVKAIAIYKKIIKLDPTRLEIYEKLAELYHKQGLINEARSQYQVLADYYSKHENAASVLSIYERMAELEPDNPSHRVKLAELYQAQQLTDQAIGEYRRIAELMISHGSPGEAEKVYERALDVDASDLDFIAEAVDRLRSAGDEGAAGRLLAVAAQKNPEAAGLADRAAPAAGEAAAGEVAAGEVAADMPAADVPAAAAETRTAAEEAISEAAAAVSGSTDPAPAEEAGEADLVLDLDDEELAVPYAAEERPPQAAAPAPAAPETEARAAGETGEFELDLDEVFVLDLEEEPAPGSQAPPPAGIESAPSPPEQHGGPAPDTPVEAVPPSLEEGVFELDEAEEPAPAPAPAAAADAAVPAADGVPPIDPEFLERTAAELLPRDRQAGDLITEAEVFAKYGLEDKAADRLQEALRLAPGHVEAMSLLIRLHLGRGQHPKVLTVANQMARIAAETGDDRAWRKIRRRLQRAGYGLDGDRVVAAPSPDGETDRAVGEMLAGILDQPTRPARKKAPPPPEVPAVPPEASAPPPSPEPERAEPEAVGEPEAAPEPEVSAPVPEPPSAREQAGEPAASEAAPELEDSGTEWLSQVEAAAESIGGEGADAVLDEEEDFFDLAAEIEQELDAEDAAREELFAPPQEQTLEEIVEGFKQGVADNLSAEDYDTHFNLGIAYREMSLLDEAIGEFQLAAKAPERLVECCSMLGLCFLEKGLPELAIKWYQRGLASETLTEDDQLGLLYDLGNVYLAHGEIDQARSVFVDIYGTNSHYRDIVAKLEEISARQ